MLPFGYGAVTRMGAASKIESLLVREYLRQKARPAASPGKGRRLPAATRTSFCRGSSVPSSMPTWSRCILRSCSAVKSRPPPTCSLSSLPLLRDLTDDAPGDQAAMQDAGPGDRSRLDAMQSSFKILINSFYGYLGYSRALFNDHAQADEVTQTGQQISPNDRHDPGKAGGKVVEVDTDGIFFVPPTGGNREEQESDIRGGSFRPAARKESPFRSTGATKRCSATRRRTMPCSGMTTRSGSKARR